MDEYDDTVIQDERLELIFTCCHPALPLDGQVALTLRALGGLETAEIARAFLRQAGAEAIGNIAAMAAQAQQVWAVLERAIDAAEDVSTT